MDTFIVRVSTSIRPKRTLSCQPVKYQAQRYRVVLLRVALVDLPNCLKVNERGIYERNLKLTEEVLRDVADANFPQHCIQSFLLWASGYARIPQKVSELVAGVCRLIDLHYGRSLVLHPVESFCKDKKGANYAVVDAARCSDDDLTTAARLWGADIHKYLTYGRRLASSRSFATWSSLFALFPAMYRAAAYLPSVPWTGTGGCRY